MRRVLEFTRVAESEFFTGAHRSPQCVAHARQLAIYLMVVELGCERPETAAALGLSTEYVRQALQTIEERRSDPALNVAIDLMAAELRRRTNCARAS